MAGLESIPVRLESIAQTGNLQPLLFEIQAALVRLATRGEETQIDLLALPFSDADQRALDRWLGEGEVTAQLDALGLSEIRESHYRGVWLITHYSPQRQVMAKLVEITLLPQVLCAFADEVAESADQLAQKLAALE